MKTRFIIAGFVACAAAAVFSLAPSPLMAAPEKGIFTKPGKGKPLALMSTLEGFEPGSKITYRIFPEEGLPARGETIVSSNGDASIPGYNMYDAGGTMLGYSIQVEQADGNTPVSVQFLMNSKTGKIGVQARGLGEFSGVGFNNPVKDEISNADWAGILNNPHAGNLADIGNKEGFRLAFYDGNIANDVTSGMPSKIIKVLAAPGGGLYQDPALNTYSFPYGCQDGDVTYSFCETSEMETQIDYVVNNYVTALIMMGEQLSAVMMQMMEPVGAFIDAKQQLEVQRDHQRLTAEAHKDYHPSALMCEFGSFMKSITTAEEKAMYEKLALNDMMVGMYTNLENASGSEGYASDTDSRVNQFRKVYCDVKDNNDGLNFMCDHDQQEGGAAGAADMERMNKDIDFTRTLDNPLTLEIDFSYAAPGRTATTAAANPDEEDIVALAKNLYWPRGFNMIQPREAAENFAGYLDARNVFAMQNVAHLSYATLAGMKSRTEISGAPYGGGDYMKSMMRNFGLSDSDIIELLGEDPSYYAQMDVLTKKLYQQPDFYTNLMDKPVNVKRINVTMQAIELMQQRDFFESALRREMLTSLLVEEALAKHIDNINGRMVSDTKNLQHK